MSEVAETVLELFDQIAASSDDGEVLATVATVRQQLGGKPPSIIIKEAVIDGHGRIKELEEKLQAMAVTPQAENGFYDLEDFVAALHKKMGRTYGWRVDYVQATQETPDCRKVKNEEIQRWQQTRKVPDWAFEQIEKLVFQQRKGENGPPWSQGEYDFLVALYNGEATSKLETGDEKHQIKQGDKYPTNSTTSNAEFARICSQEFGRPITENAIKGGIDRQRKKGRLPARRKKAA